MDGLSCRNDVAARVVEKSATFFLAVDSQANVVARFRTESCSALHPAQAAVGVLLAVLGYAIRNLWWLVKRTTDVDCGDATLN